MLFVIMANPSPFARSSAMSRWASSGPDTNDRGALRGIAKQTQREADREVEGAFGVKEEDKRKKMTARFRVGEKVKGAPGAFKIKPGAYGTIKKVDVSKGYAAYDVQLDSGGTVRALDSELARGSKPGY